MIKQQLGLMFDIIKYPIITDKSTQLIENKQYSFAVDCNIDKNTIKQTIEHIFDVQVRSVNTMRFPIKKRKVRNIVGKKTRYKKAIVTLDSNSSIDLLAK